MAIDLTAIHSSLVKVEKPARYVGGEYNQTVKPPEGARVRVALAFPDVYEIGVSYHGFKILYEILNAREGWAAERVYAPWPDFEAEMRARRIPLYTLENLSPLGEFDIIGFTLQSEINYSNVVNMLDLAGLPARASERGDPFPLVIAGGEGAMAPEPMSRFIDAFAIGDGEELFPEIVAAVEQFKTESSSGKRALLERLSRIDGVYVPSQVEFQYSADGTISKIHRAGDSKADFPPVRRRVWNLRNDAGSTRPIVPNLRVIHDRQVIEIRRGCARGCRFCHAGMTNRPVRERTLEQIMEAAREGLRSTGYGDLSLLSLSTTDHTCIKEMLRALMDEFGPRNVAVSLPSARIESFDIGLAAEISKVRKTGFTFAPEAGTERLRAVINKELDDGTFFDLVRQVFEHGWSTVKFYFMIGLPTETDTDIEGIIAAVRKTEEIGRRLWRKRLQINVTLSPFVPKPHTPFQWAAQIAPEEIKRRCYIARDGLRSKNIDVKFSDPEASLLEAALARGDRRVGEAIERAWRLGARFDGWGEHFRFDLWRRAFEEAGLDMAWHAQRERSLDEILPWDHIDAGVGKPFLRKEWDLAQCAVTVPDCSRGECAGCLACQGGKGHLLAGSYPDALKTPPSEEKSIEESSPDKGDGKEHRTAAPRGRNERGRRAPRRDEAPPAMRLRFRFSKSGRLRYISHLDLANVLTASILRARLPLAYSKGFHPRPLVTLPPPLPVGYGAEEEPLDIYLDGIVDAEEARRALAEAAPSGLRFPHAERIDLAAPNVAKLFAAADYVVTLPSGFISEADLRAAIERFAAAEHWPVKKETKTHVREIDLKTSVHIGECDATRVQILISLTEGKYVDPLQALGEILGRTLLLANGVEVTRQRIIM